MNPLRIKVLEPIGFNNNSWIDEFERQFSIQIEMQDTRCFSDEELIPFVKEADALVLSNRPLSKKIIQSSTTLKFISLAFTGTDHLDAEEIQKKGIIVKNAAGYATYSTSELVIGLALQLYRKIAESSLAISQVKSLPFPLGRQLFGKKIGIIGAGRIGTATGKLFEAFGCEVVYYTRNSDNLDEITKHADIISIHLPLTTETRHLIHKKHFNMMKPSTILINTARGPVVDQEALAFALAQKKIAGAALDVFDVEPPLPPDHILLQTPNLLLTPHIAYRTEEAVLQKAKTAIENLKNWIISLK